jgi:hypothetical protein
MKNFILIFILLAFTLPAFAQINIRNMFIDPPVSTNDGGKLVMIKKEDDASTHTWNRYRQKITIQKFDASGRFVKEVKLADGDNIFSSYYTEIKKMGERIWVFYIEVGSKNVMGHAKAIEINPVSLEIGNPVTIGSSEEMNLQPNLLTNNAYFSSNVSANGNFAYFWAATDKDPFYLVCLDANLNKVWTNKAEIEKVYNKNLNSFAVDNSGTVCMGYLKKSKPSLAFLDKSGITTDKEIDLGGRKAKDVLLLSNSKGGFHLAGSYFDAGDNCGGVYIAQINSNTFEGMKAFPFPRLFIQYLAKDNWASMKERKYGIQPEYSSKLLELPNGIPDMVSEYVIKGNTGPSTLGPMMNIRFEGKEPVFNCIPRLIVTSGINLPEQYATKIVDNKVAFYYADNPVNIKRDVSEGAVVAGKYISLIRAIVDSNGSLERKIVDKVMD